MRSWVVSVAVACVMFSVVANAHGDWTMRIQWGDSIPGGTVYTVTIDNAGKLQAERKGLPFTADGLTVTAYERTIPDESAAGLRSAGERFIRQLDFEKLQGRMSGDGGSAFVDISDGSATFGARLGRLSSREEGGKEWNDLFSMVKPLLPKDFIR
jgi:hypothetical protein